MKKSSQRYNYVWFRNKPSSFLPSALFFFHVISIAASSSNLSMDRMKESNKQNWNKLEKIIISFNCFRLLMMFSLLLFVVVAIGFVKCSGDSVIVNNKTRGLRRKITRLSLHSQLRLCKLKYRKWTIGFYDDIIERNEIVQFDVLLQFAAKQIVFTLSRWTN